MCRHLSFLNHVTICRRGRYLHAVLGRVSWHQRAIAGNLSEGGCDGVVQCSGVELSQAADVFFVKGNPGLSLSWKDYQAAAKPRDMRQPPIYLSAERRQSMEASEYPWVVYTLDNRFFYDNPAHRRIVGLSNDYDTSGRHLSEPPVPCYQCCADHFMEQNRIALENGSVQVLDLHPIGQTGDWFCHLVKHSALLNDQGQKVATLVHGKPFFEEWQQVMKGVFSMLYHLTGEKQASMRVGQVKELTDIQAEMLFLLLCRVEPKRIAYHMGCQLSTVHNCIDRIRLKLDVTTTSQLLEKVVHMGWHNMIPERLLKKQLSVILD